MLGLEKLKKEVSILLLVVSSIFLLSCASTTEDATDDELIQEAYVKVIGYIDLLKQTNTYFSNNYTETCTDNEMVLLKNNMEMVQEAQADLRPYIVALNDTGKYEFDMSELDQYFADYLENFNDLYQSFERSIQNGDSREISDPEAAFDATTVKLIEEYIRQMEVIYFRELLNTEN